jgi:hypothetical protein
MSSSERKEIPADIKTQLGALRNELLQIHLSWMVFRQIFAKQADHEFFVKLVPVFAVVCFRSIYREVILGIFRLYDPPESGKGRENLVLRRLVDLVSSRYPELEKSLGEIYERGKAELSAHEDMRNKVMAHNDLFVASNHFAGIK